MIYVSMSVFPSNVYGRSGAEIVSGGDRIAHVITTSQLGSAELLPFDTKTHLVRKGETISQLCARYNISEAGFMRLNSRRFMLGGQKELRIGDSVIVPRRPLSSAMSRYLDGDTAIASSIANYLEQGSSILR
ncbi:LysM domain-containing protein, partial [Bartonella sp. TP]|uniref:LysM peptidoglycan-binding domain-containing protein n=1 Tax=Bartonella sp. TP TaxID=3057550 RepID=UPI0025B166F1